MVARGVGAIVFLQDWSQGNRTRATDVDGLVGRLMPSGLTLEAGGGQFRPSFA